MDQFLLPYQPRHVTQHAAPTVVSRRYPWCMKHSAQSTIPGPEKSATLTDQERAERRKRFAERVFSPDGLDRDTLKHIEQLTGDES